MMVMSALRKFVFGAFTAILDDGPVEAWSHVAYSSSRN